MNDSPHDTLEALREQALKSLRFLLGGLSANGESYLLGMTKKATSNAEQAEYHDAVREYRLKWRGVETHFLANVDGGFAALREAPAPGASAPARPVAPPAPSRPDALAGLGVVDESLMDQQIAVGNIAGRASLEHREVTMSIGVQAARALGQRRPVTERLPITPQALTGAFMDACSRVEVAPRARVTLARLFARFVLDELGPFYDQCLRVFPEQSAAPLASPPSGSGQPSESGRATALPSAADEDVARSGGGASGDTRGEVLWDPQRLPMLAAPGKALAMPRNLVDDLLHDIQEELLDPEAIKAGLNARMPLQPLDVLQLINDGLQSSGQTRAMALPADVVEAIGLVRMLFEHLMRDAGVPMPVRRLTRLMQMPLLRAALREPDALSNPEHPARALLSALGRAGSAWRADGGTASEDLLRMIQLLVSRVLGDYDKNTAVFSAALADLQRFEQMRSGAAAGAQPAGGPAPAPRQAPAPAPVSRPQASPEFVQLVDKLAPDTWVELRAPGQERKRIQFVARMPRTGMFSFVDAEGQKAGEWNRNDLAHMIENAEAVILRGQGAGGPPGRPGRR